MTELFEYTPTGEQVTLVMTREEYDRIKTLVDEYDWEAAALCGSNQDPSLVRFARRCMDAGKQRWQPISTAPKDGTFIIVHGGIAHWYEGEWKTITGVAFPGRRIQWEVKHWMPFPEPPTT